jgi:hypothetical protein
MHPHNAVLEMAIRNVAGQEGRVSQQEAVVARLRREGLPTEQAEETLARMRNILSKLRDAVERLQRKPGEDK